MRSHSIRWQLSLSYAAIACLATLALGAVLLATLHGYYTGKERSYLKRNAQGFTALVASAMEKQVPLDRLSPQIRNLAFFSKTRIRVLDSKGDVLADSGIPNEPYFFSFLYSAPDRAVEGLQIQTMRVFPQSELATEEQLLSQRAADPPAMRETSQPPESGGADHPAPASGARAGYDVPDPVPFYVGPETAEGGAVVAGARSVLPISSTFYGFQLGDMANRIPHGFEDFDAGHRSNQKVMGTITDTQGHVLGTIIVSDGPAYGSAIVNSVARGWALAGGIAVVLAAVAGWFVSRQISKPLLGLTDVTVRMTDGELSARADVQRQDELGILATSFNAMADRIEEIVVTLKRFVADAAHEMHTPLTALRTNLELLDFGQNPEAVKRAHEQVIRLEKLTDGLLSLSRIEAQTGATQTSALDLVTLIRSISEIYASRAEQADLDYDLHLPEAMPSITANAEQIECVISNLLDNAIKFTPPGGTVRLNLQQVDHRAELTVQDTGIGIPPDDLPALFERFRRGRNACSYPGSGLGLAIVRAIVKTHGGSVHAESNGAGTVITVTLPLMNSAPNLA
jgi:two-component system sensor histidine kinase BaeS